MYIINSGVHNFRLITSIIIIIVIFILILIQTNRKKTMRKTVRITSSTNCEKREHGHNLHVDLLCVHYQA